MVPKYPWLRIRNVWTGNLVPDSDNESWQDELPFGWNKAFGEQLIDELNELLVKYNYVDCYMIVQIKEKFGGLRWYDNGVPRAMYKEHSELISKYERLSEETCIECGKKGVVRTDLWWILPLCDEHYAKCSNKRGR